MQSIHWLCSAIVVGLVTASGVLAQEKSTEELAREAQNPVADVISIPFQNNFNFGYGPYGKLQDVLNIQPVVPFHLTEDWNLITRTIMPLISQPQLTPFDNREWGLGDVNPTLFLSPAHPGQIIWGIGPTFTMPTATQKNLGSNKWSAGPAFIALTIQGPWVLGALISNQWSFASAGSGKAVNAMLIQPFRELQYPWRQRLVPHNEPHHYRQLEFIRRKMGRARRRWRRTDI